MNEIEFCYWLQGFIELSNPEEITIEQWDSVKQHLQLVFNKVTPTTTLLSEELTGYYNILDTKHTGCSGRKLC